MEPVFEIIPEAIFFQQTNLICEISRDGFAYIFENEVDKKFHGLSVFHFNNTDIPGQLKEIFNEQPLLHKNYKKIFISYSGEESALLPEELYRPGENELLLNTLYGDLDEGTVATDLLTNKKIYNVYRMPVEVRKVLVENFPLAVFSHQYSLLVKQDLPADIFKLIFYRDVFVAVLNRGGELQLIQSYHYHSGADVVYHLLNVCNQFLISTIPLCIGGMLERNSHLHKEIAHYFPDITFDELPTEYEFSNGLKEVPPHYFSHLFSLALCV